MRRWRAQPVVVAISLCVFAEAYCQTTGHAEEVTLSPLPLLKMNSVEGWREDEQPIVKDFIIPEFSPFGFLLTYFPSEFIRNGIELKSYVRSKRFRQIRQEFGGLRAVDALYIRALRLTEGNTTMALFFCAIATMDHRVVGLEIPFLKLFLPLSNESPEEFAGRLANLPNHFYSDSPGNRTGDRDKLQHFFGSAFIANLFESRGAAERTGSFIELGEDAFIVQGAYDERDMRANRQGQEFGLALLNADPAGNSHTSLPSDFLRVHLAAQKEAEVYTDTHFCGAW